MASANFIGGEYSAFAVSRKPACRGPERSTVPPPPQKKADGCPSALLDYADDYLPVAVLLAALLLCVNPLCWSLLRM